MRSIPILVAVLGFLVPAAVRAVPITRTYTINPGGTQTGLAIGAITGGTATITFFAPTAISCTGCSAYYTLLLRGTAGTVQQNFGFGPFPLATVQLQPAGSFLGIFHRYAQYFPFYRFSTLIHWLATAHNGHTLDIFHHHTTRQRTYTGTPPYSVPTTIASTFVTFHVTGMEVPEPAAVSLVGLGLVALALLLPLCRRAVR
jgi:hypothetical protein